MSTRLRSFICSNPIGSRPVHKRPHPFKGSASAVRTGAPAFVFDSILRAVIVPEMMSGVRGVEPEISLLNSPGAAPASAPISLPPNAPAGLRPSLPQSASRKFFSGQKSKWPWLSMRSQPELEQRVTCCANQRCRCLPRRCWKRRLAEIRAWRKRCQYFGRMGPWPGQRRLGRPGRGWPKPCGAQGRGPTTCTPR